MQAEEVTAVAKAVLPWIMQRAAASSRLCNLLQLWRAVVDVDLNTWRGAPPERVHAGALIDVLEEPLVRALRGGTHTVRAALRLPPQTVACLTRGAAGRGGRPRR